MKLSLQIKGTILAAISSVAALALAFAGSKVFQPAPTPASASAPASGDSGALVVPPAGTVANQGYKLFMLNCAHCHGTDARGDEGPDLHGVTKSDARIASMIKNGIKGEMPKFSTKLTDADVQALIAFVRTLGD
jgi:mono/diheme cytochrome c family protein